MIDPEKLRHRLHEVWAALGDEVLRACALTLVTVVDEDDHPDEVSQTLAELMPTHPSRAILLRLEPGSADRLEADVEARCWMPFGRRKQVCCEQIVIRATEQTLDQAAGIVLPLLAPDLPVVLWCTSARAWKSDCFPALAAPAGRVLLDSARIPAAFGAPGVADLSWTRLTRWRALLAQAMENEHLRRHLPHFSRLLLRHERTHSPAALLFAGWLTSRLGWDEDRLRHGLHFESASADGIGRLLGFELSTDPPTPSPQHPTPAPQAPRPPTPARVSALRTGPGCGEVRLQLDGLAPVTTRVSLEPSTDLLLLSEELSIQAPDPVYDQSVAWARHIAEIHHERPVV